MAITGLWSRVTSAIFGFAIGGAASAAIEPIVQPITNEAWSQRPEKPLAASVAAALVAEGEWTEGEAVTEAAMTGINDGRLKALVSLADTPPEAGQLMQLYRRGLIGEGAMRKGLRRLKMEPEWIDQMLALRDVLLTPDTLANARQQGFVKPARQIAESELHGVGAERAEILYLLAGNPPGPMDGLTMLRRNIIDEPTYREIVAEGRTKTKYTDAFLGLRTPVLSAADFAELRLRGWISPAESYAGGALTGHTPDQMDKLFQNRGRPATPRQMWLAIRRGNATRADFDRAIVQSNIRPEYADWLWSIRYSYPSLFQLRGAVQSGGLTPARALTILDYQGYEDQDAQAVVASWARAGAAAGRELTKAELGAEYEGLFIDEAQYRAALTQLGYTGPTQDLEVHLGDARRVKQYRDAIVSALHADYVANDADDADVTAALAEIAVSPDAIGHLLRLWAIERREQRRQLTAAQVKRGYKRGHLSLADAVGRLEDMGYDPAEITVLLD